MASRGSRNDSQQDWNARALARRNQDAAGKPLSPVMKTAVTATELAHGAGAHKRDDRTG